MGGKYPKGGWGDIPGAFAPLGGGDIPIDYSSPGAVFLGISPPFERGRISWGGGQKSCDNGMGK